MSAEPTIPPIVARMWGKELASTHGPRPSLDLAAITGAAIEIADRDGLAGVRMSSVAERLGVATMSLYRYVGSKDDLLTAMVDAAAPEPPEIAGAAWRAYLARWTRANRDMLLARPWLLQIPRWTPPIGPRGLRWLDRILTAFEPTGLEAGQCINIATVLTGYAESHATLTHGLRQPSDAMTDHAVTGVDHYGAILAAVLDPGSYPALTRAAQDGAFGDDSEWINDADFVFGLELVLDGVAALIARRRS